MAATFLLSDPVIGSMGGVRQADAAETSAAVTRQDSIALPDILSPGDVVLHRRIAAAEKARDWALSDRMIAALRDRRLVGTVLAKRYLDRSYKTSFAELAAWLEQNRDHPQASELFQLALKRKPKDAPRPKPPLGGPILTGHGDDLPVWVDKPYRAKTVADALTSRVRDALGRGERGFAAAMLEADRNAAVDPVAHDMLASEVASALFANGNDRDALGLASKAARSADLVPQAAWIAGLASWRLGQRDQATGYFQQVAQSASAAPWTQSAGAFWAGRGLALAGKSDDARLWFSRAAEQPYSFYGQLAAKRLGERLRLDWSLPAVHARQIALLQPFPAVMRALALIQLEQRDDAERELRAIFLKLPAELQPIVATLAERGGLPGLALRIATHLQAKGGTRFDAAFYPVPPWVPSEGFSINRALLYAFARQESHFDPDARSSMGASGLMQIMPHTARGLAQEDGGPDHAARLDDPSASLEVGQRLIEHLFDQDAVKNNLMHLTVAYAGGPGLLQRYQDRQRHQADPLLYMEGLPAADVRLYVQRVLTTYWIYQQRLGQEPESLSALADQRWPLYVPPTRQVEVAESPEPRN